MDIKDFDPYSLGTVVGNPDCCIRATKMHTCKGVFQLSYLLSGKTLPQADFKILNLASLCSWADWLSMALSQTWKQGFLLQGPSLFYNLALKMIFSLQM